MSDEPRLDLTIDPDHPVAVWIDDNHSLNVGRLLMTMVLRGLKVTPVLDAKGNYTPWIKVTLADDGLPERTLRLYAVTV